MNILTERGLDLTRPILVHDAPHGPENRILKKWQSEGGIREEHSLENPCECQLCHARGEYRPAKIPTGPYDEGLAPIEVSKAAVKMYAEELQFSQRLLKGIMTLHGATLIKRWRRKNQKQRREVLKAAAPQLCPRDHASVRVALHTFDDEFTQEFFEKRMMARMHGLLPYLNLERLSADYSRLLLLMCGRSTMKPEFFAPFDVRQFRSARMTGLLPQKLANGSVAMHGKDYGSWKTTDLDKLHRREELGATQGQLVLEAQEKLNVFLLCVASQILGDHLPTMHWDEATLGEGSRRLGTAIYHQLETRGWPDPPKEIGDYVRDNITGKRRKGDWQSFVARNEDLPFQLLTPMSWRMKRLAGLTWDRLLEIKDRLWLMQTNPSTLRRSLLEETKHLQGFVSTAGTSSNFSNDKWKCAIDYGVFARILRHTEWQVIFDELLYILDEHGSTIDQVQPNQTLPASYEHVLGCLWSTCFCLQGSLRFQLESRALSHPTMRRFLKKSPARSDTNDSISATEKSVEENLLLVLVLVLCSKQVNHFHLDLPSSLQFLDELISSASTAQKAVIDSAMLEIMSDLAILEDILITLDLHRPAHRFMSMKDEPDNPRPSWLRYRRMYDRSGDINEYSRDWSAAAALLHPLNKFSIPNGERDARWLKKSEDAHASSRLFWSAVEDETKAWFRASKMPNFAWSPYENGFTFYKNVQHLEMIAEEHQRARDDLHEREVRSDLASLSFQMAESDTKRDVQHPVKQKPKTRPEPKHEDQQCGGEDEPTKPLAPNKPRVTLYALSAKEIEIIDHMFPSPASGTIHKTTFDWMAFAALMTKLGFGVQGTGGSGVRFSGTINVEDSEGKMVEQDHSIIVHKPHAPPEVGPEWLQEFGKRCARHWQWRREHFADK